MATVLGSEQGGYRSGSSGLGLVHSGLLGFDSVSSARFSLRAFDRHSTLLLGTASGAGFW